MKLLPWSLVLMSFWFSSCRPGNEKKSVVVVRQKVRDDSIRRAVEEKTRQEVELRYALKDSVRRLNIQIKELNTKITNLKADLLSAEDRLQLIKQPQFLRTPAEREQQIKDQALRISAIEDHLIRTQAQLRTHYKLLEEWEMVLRQLKK